MKVMKTKRISLVATYNASNRLAVESLVSNMVVNELYEVILVNEGNTKNIVAANALSICVTNFKHNSEPFVMAIGAHYADGDVVLLCRKPESITSDLLMKLLKSRRNHSPGEGLHVFMRSAFPWRYDKETGFEKGRKGRFIHLAWEVVNAEG